MNWQSRTIKTYDMSAEALADYFKGIGARTKDIELALELAKQKGRTGKVIEIGCGDGRDAVEIVKRTAWYEGLDPSQGLLDIARRKLPGISFKLSDAQSYEYPDNLDVIYAFASLLHVNKSDLGIVLKKVARALRTGGIFYISLKERDKYSEDIKEDKYGSRKFYFYNSEIIKELSQDLFTSVYEDQQQIGDTKWFTIALKKN